MFILNRYNGNKVSITTEAHRFELHTLERLILHIVCN